MTELGVPMPPVALTRLAGDGRLAGSNSRYERCLADLKGLYRDADAYASELVGDDSRPRHWVENSQNEEGLGGLITGPSVLEPGSVGREYGMTRGHMHAVADRAELYLGVAGRGVMILETLDGRSQVVEVTSGKAVYVPGWWVHRSVNVGQERFVTLFCYAADAGQDYAIIDRAGGMQSLVVIDGDSYAVEVNPGHRGYRRSSFSE
jgi:glucose-6-phosphate isomerase